MVVDLGHHVEVDAFKHPRENGVVLVLVDPADHIMGSHRHGAHFFGKLYLSYMLFLHMTWRATKPSEQQLASSGQGAAVKEHAHSHGHAEKKEGDHRHGHHGGGHDEEGDSVWSSRQSRYRAYLYV